MVKVVDMTGEKIGRLTVLERAEKPDTRFSRPSAAYWRCKCECGTIKTVMGTSLRKGSTRSCGCIRKELIRFIAHKTNEPSLIPKDLYRRWYFLTRKHKDVIDPRWLESIHNFLADIPEYNPGDSLVRIDPDKKFEKGNVKWVRGHKAQVSYEGKMISIRHLSNITNIPYNKLLNRITKHNLTAEEAVEIGNKYLSINRHIEMVGKYGMLTAVKRVPRPTGYKSNGTYWLFKCDCGNERIVEAGQVRKGKATSCGCTHARNNYSRTVRAKLGNDFLFSSLLVRTWQRLKTWHKPDSRWDTFEGFVDTLDVIPIRELEFLKRIDDTKPYGPGNVEWILTDKPCDKIVVYKGRRVRVGEVLKREGIKRAAYWYRLDSKGMSPEDAIQDCIDKLNQTGKYAV